MFRRPAAVVVGASGAALLASCATAPVVSGAASTVELVLAYDAAPATETIAFPTSGYESVVRFDLPPGEHQLRSVRLQAAAAGAFKLTLYGSSPLDGPGEAIHAITREVAPAEVSDGKDGRWLVDDLTGLESREGTTWVGVAKRGGDFKLWASAVASEDKAFMRNTDPQNAMGLMSVKRAPMLRLEVAP